MVLLTRRYPGMTKVSGWSVDGGGLGGIGKEKGNGEG